MIGSRKRLVLSMATVKRRTCASEMSRWKGVGATLSIGSAVNRRVWPPSGSRYIASTAPPSARTASASAVSSAVVSVSARSVAPSSVGLSLTPRRLRGEPLGFLLRALVLIVVFVFARAERCQKSAEAFDQKGAETRGRLRRASRPLQAFRVDEVGRRYNNKG